MVDWMIEPLTKGHRRNRFSCGKASLDDFIRSRVTQYEKRRLGRTFVAVAIGGADVLGYFTLAASAISFEHMPEAFSRKLPRHPVPVVLLARLAVDLSTQGMRLGEGLLLDALERSLALSANMGIHAIEVDAIDDEAAAFYRKYGFSPLLDRSLHLFLPIATVKTLFE